VWLSRCIPRISNCEPHAPAFGSLHP
jgi:hypothetical protein